MEYIHWNPDSEIFSFLGFSIRWYGLLWAFGLLGTAAVVSKINRNSPTKLKVEQLIFLFYYCLFGTLIGARLGHCIFYGADYFFSSWTHFIEIFLPIRIYPDGSLKYIGYAGLASHGGVIGLAVAFWIFCKQFSVKLLFVLDTVAYAAPFCAMMIRLGNLMNSEIIGCPTTVPWAFIFDSVDSQPRHPAQLYEAMFYGLVFIVGVLLYKKNTFFSKSFGTGFYFGYCITTIFTFRFFIEFLKEVQEDFERTMILDMGQLLSIPIILVGLYFLLISLYKKKKNCSMAYN